MGVAGNHDIGFGETIVLSAHDRFIKTFGELNHVTRVANHSFVALDTIGLSGLESSSPYINAFQFLQSLDTKIPLDPLERRILITHVPLWRPENVDCGPRRITKPIRNFRGYQYQNLIQYPIASRVLSIVKPSLTISGTFLSFTGGYSHSLSNYFVITGDDHDDCVYEHHINGEKYLEHSIGTFSWLQGNIYPSFGVMTLRKANAEPIDVSLPSFSLEICSLPAQLTIYEWYIALALLSLAGIFYSTMRWQTRMGVYQRISGSSSNYQSFIKHALGMMKELLLVVLSFYAIVMLLTYYF